MPDSSHESTMECVVQIGFAGSRQLFRNPPKDPDVERQWHDELLNHVKKTLEVELPSRLNLSGHHFICGISQIARGSDVIFARALKDLDYPHRIFLPQPVDDYLAATGSDGTPDFTVDEERQSRELLESENIIQQRVVSSSSDRGDRFRETNAEILRVSDLYS